jgi:PhzF family phenazine biosynthesis protein
MRIFQVDAFTGQPFAGNPAAVCLLDRDADDEWMQRVPMEMNLSETTFVRLGDSGQPVGLRWFTPTTEVALCGHATLASAHILFEEGLVAASPSAFQPRAASLPLSALPTPSSWTFRRPRWSRPRHRPAD